MTKREIQYEIAQSPKRLSGRVKRLMYNRFLRQEEGERKWEGTYLASLLYFGCIVKLNIDVYAIRIE